MKPAFQRYWPPLLLLGMVVIFLGDVWFGGRMLFLRDFFFGDAPVRIQYGELLRHGSFGLWQTTQCGTPGAAQPLNQAFYPPNWIFVLPWVELDIRLWWTFHLAVAALGWYALARYWRLAIAPALLAAISFTFSTQVITLMEGSQAFSAMVWGPLVLLCVSRIIDRVAELSGRGIRTLIRGNAISVVVLALLAALQITANEEYFYYTTLIAGAYAVARCIWFRSWKVWRRSTLLLVGAGILGSILAAPQLVLTSELIPLSAQTGEADPLLKMASVYPRHWLTLILPFLYGRPGYPAAYWGPKMHEFTIGHCYVGIIPLISVVFAWLWFRTGQVARERRFQIVFFAALGGAGLLMAAGELTPVYAFMHHWLPGMGAFRLAPKFYLFAAYALTAISALGFEKLIVVDDDKAEEKNRFRLWWGITSFFIILFCGFMAAVLNSDFLPWLMSAPASVSAVQKNSALFDYGWAMVFSAMAVGMFGLLVFKRGPAQWIRGGIVTLAFVNLLVISRQVQPTAAAGIYTKRPEQLVRQHPDERFLSLYYQMQQYFSGEERPELLDWAVETGATNATRLEGMNILTPGGMALKRYSDLFVMMSASSPQISEKIADMMSLRYVIQGEHFSKVLWENGSRDFKVVERIKCLPRAFVVCQWKVAATEKEALNTIVSDAFDPHKEAVVEPLKGMRPIVDSKSSTEEAIGEVSAFDDHRDALTMKVWLNKRGLLVLNDTWYPGWIVKVDGFTQPIYRANYHFRGVFLEPGAHQVEFTYKPVRFTIGICIFFAGVLACGALVWYSRQTQTDSQKEASRRRSRRRKKFIFR